MNLSGKRSYFGGQVDDSSNGRPPKLFGESSIAPISSYHNDNIYWNIIITNQGNEVAEVDADVTYTQSLTTDGTSRYLSPIRFVLDGTTIPIFFFQTGAYTVTIRDGGLAATTPVIYDTSYVGNGWYPGEQPIFTYNSFIDMINVALKAAHDTVHGADGNEPIMFYNPATGLCGIAVKTASPYAPGGTGQIYMNNILYNFFGNFDAKLSTEVAGGLNNPRYAEILIRNYVFNNGSPVTGYIFVTQEYQSLYLWFDITTVEFVSNRLRIRSEFIPTITVGTQINNASAGSGTASANVLTDFQPSYQPGDQAGPRGYMYYVPGAQYRLIDILNDDIKDFDLKINLVDRIGKRYPYYLPPKQTLYLKMILVKKDLFKN